MNQNNISFIISAVGEKQYPPGGLPEIALAGRSNVGKSSFINKMTNRKNFARVSQTPGKTATVNFYNVDDCLMMVDLPGYGFAKTSKEQRKSYGVMIENYIKKRQPLCAVMLIIDIRHKPTEDDVLMCEWVRYIGFRPIIIANKVDKIKKSERDEKLGVIWGTLTLTEDDVLIPFSAVSGEGKEEVWECIMEMVECRDANE